MLYVVCYKVWSLLYGSRALDSPGLVMKARFSDGAAAERYGSRSVHRPKLTYIYVYIYTTCSYVCIYVYIYIDMYTIYLHIYMPIYPCIHLSIHLSIYPSIYPSIYLSIYPLSVYPSIHVSICAFCSLSLSLSFPVRPRRPVVRRFRGGGGASWRPRIWTRKHQDATFSGKPELVGIPPR